MKRKLIRNYSKDCFNFFEQSEQKMRVGDKPIAMVYDSIVLEKHPQI